MRPNPRFQLPTETESWPKAATTYLSGGDLERRLGRQQQPGLVTAGEDETKIPSRNRLHDSSAGSCQRPVLEGLYEGDSDGPSKFEWVGLSNLGPQPTAWGTSSEEGMRCETATAVPGGRFAQRKDRHMAGADVPTCDSGSLSPSGTISARVKNPLGRATMVKEIQDRLDFKHTGGMGVL